MKNKLLALSLIAFSFSAGFLKAQNNQGTPAALNAAGSTTINGVEIFYNLTTSGGSDKVILHVVNQNANSVKATWKNRVVTKNNQVLNGSNIPESVTIAPKIRASDDDPNTIQVEVKLSDFHTSASDFKTFTVSDFDVIIIQ